MNKDITDLIDRLWERAGQVVCPEAELHEEAAKALAAIRDAFHDVYYAGFWTCDRPVNASALWTTLRDELGFASGCSPKPLPETVANSLVNLQKQDVTYMQARMGALAAFAIAEAIEYCKRTGELVLLQFNDNFMHISDKSNETSLYFDYIAQK
jgi:hypothetical protein